MSSSATSTTPYNITTSIIDTDFFPFRPKQFVGLEVPSFRLFLDRYPAPYFHPFSSNLRLRLWSLYV